MGAPRHLSLILECGAMTQKPATPSLQAWSDGVLLGGSYRDRTDDIHGVNVALYQLS